MNASARRTHRLCPGFCRGCPERRHHQSGVALIVALILLAVIILIGLNAIRGTTIQQKMTANFYDRKIAFQSAEAALRAATVALSNNAAAIARNCGSGGVACDANPFQDTLPAGSIQTVPTGTASGQFAGSCAVD